MPIEYRSNTANANEISTHFGKCDPVFNENLSKRISIDSYSQKLEQLAQRFELWDNTHLVGLLAAYFNNTTNKVGYITNVSVISAYARQGLASRLLKKCIEYAIVNDFTAIKLEVHQNNTPAIRLYNTFHFKQTEKKGDFLTLQLALT